MKGVLLLAMRYQWLTLLLLLTLLSGNISAQLTETTLKGYLGVQGGEVYTYELVFTDSSGYLKGHSNTYLYENKEVKTTISGFIDRNSQTLSFKETQIVYNHGFESYTTICLINAVLKYVLSDDGRETYSGPITSSDVSNVYCGRGTVTFPYSNELRSLFSSKNTSPAAIPKIAKPANTFQKGLKVVYDTAATETPAPVVANNAGGPEKITAGTEKVIDWHTDDLIIEVWDGGKVDGDRLTIIFNGKKLVENFTISKKHERFQEYNIPEGISEIVFTAVHEGNEPPMTANVLLIDGANKHDMIVYNPMGKKARIKIRKTGSR